jgi:hypothetical protein
MINRMFYISEKDNAAIRTPRLAVLSQSVSFRLGI